MVTDESLLCFVVLAGERAGEGNVSSMRNTRVFSNALRRREVTSEGIVLKQHNYSPYPKRTTSPWLSMALPPLTGRLLTYVYQHEYTK